MATSAPLPPAGDEGAALDFALLDRLRPALLRFFERRGGIGVDAEDLVQEVFFRLARQGSAQPLREPERYVFRIATNVLRDQLRRGLVRCRANHVSLEESADLAEAPSAERVYQGEELLQAVLTVLAQLTPRCRTIFVLQRFEGLSYSEIARRLGVSRSAIEKQMMHVIRMLAEQFPE